MKDSHDTNSALRERVLLQTLRVVKRRRQMRRALWCATLAGCYAAGVLTTSWLTRGEVQPANSGVPVEVATAADEKNLTANETPMSSAPIKLTLKKKETTPATTTPSTLAHRNRPQPPSRYEKLRHEGDKRLNDPRKVASAAEYYARAAALASDDQRAIDPEQDSWLLMAFKLDQSTEKNHVDLNN